MPSLGFRSPRPPPSPRLVPNATMRTLPSHRQMGQASKGLPQFRLVALLRLSLKTEPSLRLAPR
jgi:hypothetical protein